MITDQNYRQATGGCSRIQGHQQTAADKIIFIASMNVTVAMDISDVLAVKCACHALLHVLRMPAVTAPTALARVCAYLSR